MITVPVLQWQAEFLKRDKDPMLIVSAGVGSGKSQIAAIWAARKLVQGEEVLVAAQTYQALHRVILRNIMATLDQWKIRYRYNKTDKEIIVNNKRIIGFSHDAYESILGLSDIPNLLMDEAGYAPELAYHFAKDRLRGSNITQSCTRMVTSPDNSNSTHAWFCALARREELRGNLIYASTLDNKFISETYKADLIERYPPGTPMYEQQVLGHILDADVKMAILNRRDFSTIPIISASCRKYMGIDLADVGGDNTVFTIGDDTHVIDIIKTNTLDTWAKIAKAKELIRQYGVTDIALDATGGFGTAIYDALKNESSITVHPINFGAVSSNDNHENMRVSMYFNAVDDIRNIGYYVTDEDTITELINTQYAVSKRGNLCLVPKEATKKIIGHSPDSADAFVLMLWAKHLATDSFNNASTASAIASRLAALD